ncbi:MAG TPA: flagellar hook-associated protein FlgK [Armatimonadota bacterium]|nr:flagellar hook-associated protein FlgK [Armatimonadota bacterium]
MSSTFQGIETALRGTLAHQQAVNTAAHNVANASTPGYSRQTPIFTTTAGSPAASFAGYPTAGPTGTGVSISQIQRQHDQYLDGRLRDSESTYSFWETQQQSMEEIEGVVSQSEGSGLNALMDDFWNAWQSFSQATPDDAGIRTVALAKGTSLAVGFNAAANNLAQVGSDARATLNDSVKRVNEIAKGLASVNSQLRAIGGMGGEPNDLLDQRDALLSELSGLADIDVYEGEYGACNVAVGSRLLVQETKAASLSVPLGSPAQVFWEDGQQADISEGKIAGLMQVENAIVPAQQAKLTALRTALVTRVNALHQTGKDLDGNMGGDFFTVAGDGTVSVAITDPRRLAVSADGSTGNADVALAIAGLRNAAIPEMGNITLREDYSAWVSEVGAQSRELGDMTDRTGARRDAMQKDREGVAGVNLDEEAAHLVQWQRAFTASAKVMTVLDDMLKTVIEDLGVG